jgi:CelD/BcsL family acetyltransferase involved in cellulose biosynthesis
MLVDEIASFEALERLRPEWDELWRRCPDATPFQSPAWLLAWRKVFGGGELFSFAARVDGRLVGLAPMFLHPWDGRRQVTLLGNGVSDILDWLLDPDCRAQAADALLAAVLRHRERWDLCDWQDLPEKSVLLDRSADTQPQYVCMSIPLPDDWETFRAGLPHGLRRNLRRYREQLDQHGEVRFETAGADALPELFELHRARWAERNDPGMFDGAAMQSFHAQAGAALFEEGLARLYVLRVNQKAAAMVYGFADRGRFYSYQGGFDPALARFSPGALILEYAIAQAIGEGARVFDFLRGQERYKYDWGAAERSSYRRLLRTA